MLRPANRPRSLRTVRHLIAVIACPGLTAQAQSSFDAAVTPERRWQVAVDAMSYAAPRADSGWIWLNPRVYRGTSARVEVGAGASVYSSPHGGASTLQSSLKWRLAQLERTRLSIATGGQAMLALTPTGDSYAMVFASIERSFTADRQAIGSVAVGHYQLIREANRLNDHRGQILTGWRAAGPWRLSGSWLTGRNFFGYRTATLTYTTSSGRWFGAGYSRGNASWHNAGPYLSAGRLF